MGWLSTILGLYGAGLSSFLAWERYIERQPIFLVVPGRRPDPNDSWIAVKIINREVYPILIDQVHRIKPDTDSLAITRAETAGLFRTEVYATPLDGPLNLLIGPKDEGLVELLVIGSDKDLEIQFCWSSQRPIIRWPRRKRIRRTASQIRALNGSAQLTKVG